jgi:serine protease Do
MPENRRPHWLPLGFLSVGAAAIALLSAVHAQHAQKTVVAQAPAVQADSLAPLVERVRGTVVGVSTVRASDADVPPEVREFWRRFFGEEPPSGERTGIGSGVVIRPEGVILTNNHVVEGASEVRIRTADGKDFSAEVVGTDPPTDIAVLRVLDLPGPLPAAALGESESTRVGDRVIAIGSPFGLELTVTSGIVSAKARVLGAGPYDDFLQTDAAINPGNSGGPLFDMEGRVVGINTAIVAAGQGIGFAVPIDLVRSALPQLEQKGRVVRGYMGVAIQDVTPELAEAMGLDVDRGALVASISPDGPAADTDLRPGDVIVSLDGEPIERAQDLSRRISQMAPSTEVRLGVRRDGREREVRLELGERPGEGRPRSTPPDEEDSGLGLQVGPVPLDLQRRLGIDGGVLVIEVRSGSRADQAGLAPQDVIVEVNRRPVSGPEDFVEMVRRSRGDRLLLRVLRGQGAAFLVIPPAK